MMEWFVFFLVMGNIFINAIVLNAVIKDREILAKFVTNTKLMSSVYKNMAEKYNEVANSFNAVIKTGNNQADIIEAILTGLLADPRLAPEALQWLTTAQAKMTERLDRSVEFTDPAKF